MAPGWQRAGRLVSSFAPIGATTQKVVGPTRWGGARVIAAARSARHRRHRRLCLPPDRPRHPHPHPRLPRLLRRPTYHIRPNHLCRNRHPRRFPRLAPSRPHLRRLARFLRSPRRHHHNRGHLRCLRRRRHHRQCRHHHRHRRSLHRSLLRRPPRPPLPSSRRPSRPARGRLTLLWCSMRAAR